MNTVPVIPILFESAELLAVAKPVGIATIHEQGSALNVHELLQSGCARKLYIIHRLDKEVSGILVFAKNAAVHRRLNMQFASREVRKTYRALVQGKVEFDSGRIDFPLREFGSGRVAVDPERGKPSVTEYHVLHRTPCTSLLELMPHTGRRHQLRAHLYALGHPIVGDLRYGQRSLQEASPRLMLHAWRIEFPASEELGGDPVDLESSLPEALTLP